MPISATIRRGFPTVGRLLAPVRWLFASRRRVVTFVVICLTLAAAPVVWWESQLVGLPDVGDPFDVAAFQVKSIPDDRNAFTFYRQAMLTFKPTPGGDTSWSTLTDGRLRWDASPQLYGWAEANGPALELIRQGAECPDAFDPSSRTLKGFLGQNSQFSLLQRLVLLEASRHEAAGRMDEAWIWYRVHLRTSHHVAARAQLVRRQEAQIWQTELRTRMTNWLANPHTTPEQIRLALADVVECGRVAPSDLDTLEAQYIALEQNPEGWGSIQQLRPPGWLLWLHFRKIPVSSELFKHIHNALRFWRREPERSRRLGRLLTANRLAFLNLLPGQRPPPDPDILTLNLYQFGPEAPESARRLSTTALDRWLGSSAIAGELTALFNWQVIQAKERTTQRDLLILLGSELFRRERGVDPAQPEDLVGPYLQSLPAEFID